MSDADLTTLTTYMFQSTVGVWQMFFSAVVVLVLVLCLFWVAGFAIFMVRLLFLGTSMIGRK